METWKIIVLCALCVALGIYIGTILDDTGDGQMPACTDPVCCQQLKEAMAKCNTILPPDGPPSSITPVADIGRLRLMKAAYSGSLDTFGYSVDRDMLLYLGSLLNNGPAIKGFRFYPGKEGTSNVTLFIPLINGPAGTPELFEDSTGIKGFQMNPQAPVGYTGPCPTWCGTRGRTF